jgi:hypothetical protein
MRNNFAMIADRSIRTVAKMAQNPAPTGKSRSEKPAAAASTRETAAANSDSGRLRRQKPPPDQKR